MAHRLRILALVFAAVMAVATTPASADVKTARSLIEKGEYEQAFYELLPMAEAQDPAAQYLVGGLYLIGRGVPQDPGEARKWLIRAAHNGHAEAAMALGDMSARGFGSKPDPAQALVWYRRAAEQGIAAAQNNVGIAMASGKGTRLDLKGAVQWLERAARQGNQEAQFNLGHLFSRGGPHVKADPEQALTWFAIAAKAGLKEAEKPRDALIKQLGRKSKLPLATAQRFVAKPETAAPPTMPLSAQEPEAKKPETAPPPPPPTEAAPPQKPEPKAAEKPVAEDGNDKVQAPLPAPRKMNSNSYKIQVACGPSQSDVAKEASRLRFEMPDLLGNLEVSIVNGEAGFTALMGPFAKPGQAEALCDKLKLRGFDGCTAVPP